MCERLLGEINTLKTCLLVETVDVINRVSGLHGDWTLGLCYSQC